MRPALPSAPTTARASTVSPPCRTTATVRRSGTAEPCCSTRCTATPVRSSAPAFCACSTSCWSNSGRLISPNSICRDLRVRLKRPLLENVTACTRSFSGSSKPGGNASREGPMMPPPQVL